MSGGPAIPSLTRAVSYSAGLTRVDPKTEAKQIQLETLVSGEEDADQAVRHT